MPKKITYEELVQKKKKCQLCEGRGYRIDSGKFLDCNCMLEFKENSRYLKASIPKKFWKFKLKNLTSEFIDKNRNHLGKLNLFMTNVDDLIEEGIGILLYSYDYGAAKSAIAATLLKEIINKGYTGKWIQGTDLFNDFYNRSSSDDSIIDRLDNYDCIVLDELDKIFIPRLDADKSKLTTFVACEFFDKIYRQEIAIIATGNKSVADLAKDYPPSIIDRMQGWDLIPITGTDFRKSTKKLEQFNG